MASSKVTYHIEDNIMSKVRVVEGTEHCNRYIVQQDVQGSLGRFTMWARNSCWKGMVELIPVKVMSGA